MTTPRRGYADGPFGQVHFQHLGEGDPVVLLHQAPMTSGQFDNVYAPLAARGFHAIGIDMPGFGLSDPVPFVPGVGDYAKAVPPVLNALGISACAILGHHTGALAATEAVLQFPDRFSALILNGPLPITEAERQDFMNGLHRRELDYKAKPHAQHMVELFDIRDDLAEGTISDARLSDYVIQAMVGKGAYWHGHHAAYQYRHDETLAAIEHRTLILTNTGDVIFDLAQRARAIRPDFAYAALEGGGIDIVDQQPEAWADAVSAFLRS
ncbi:alpha/beta fold hydrolase [Sphingobium boeckii]|uniref:Pimeloyl-ACP methyl ester carboxylesterase n=1 Tax=Sphingobium boeckii TaxID=1082345 RepID=A0A7W9AK42_9SPHN|nr:alpha/beta hydrolase [Sphingobium boeckii]MBB5686904.1 pimeloyl-ACP methyl ester carboxylesterase [Sphingobium boeckii]